MQQAIQVIILLCW